MTIADKILKEYNEVKESDDFKPLIKTMAHLRDNYNISLGTSKKVLILVAEALDIELSFLHTKIALHVLKSELHEKHINNAVTSSKANLSKLFDKLNTDVNSNRIVKNENKESDMSLIDDYNETTDKLIKANQVDIRYPDVLLDSDGLPLSWDDLSEEQWKYFVDKQKFINYTPLKETKSTFKPIDDDEKIMYDAQTNQFLSKKEWEETYGTEYTSTLLKKMDERTKQVTDADFEESFRYRNE